MMDHATEIPAEYLGPAMSALGTERLRRFAFFMGGGLMNGAEAAREAGYADSNDGCKRRAYTLMQQENVLTAIQEVARRALTGLVPAALRAAEDILADKANPQRARMVETILDRTGFAAKTEHTVHVAHEHVVQLSVEKAEARIRELLDKFNLPALPAPIDVQTERTADE